jgi:23S rRNA (adenine2503-C2)-methyltransferase
MHDPDVDLDHPARARRAGARLATVADLRAHFLAAGAAAPHVRRFLAAWLGGRPLDEPRVRRSPLRSSQLVASLPSLQRDLDALVTEISRHPAPDGSCRRLLRLRSGRTVECVDLPRDGLCISTQVGCAVGCRFCRTGEDGLIEQLTALDLLAQVALARRERPVRRVVFMGMGEPSHNLEATLDAIDVLGHAGRFAHKELVFSTIGDPRVFQRLHASKVRPALAVSLHTTDAALRRELLPRAPRVDPIPLVEASLAYADDTGHPLLIQWTLLAGVNDSIDEARRLGAILEGRRVIVNYIPFNPVEGSGYRRPRIERCVELVRVMKRSGTRATLRLSAGQEVDAACGQLRARSW